MLKIRRFKISDANAAGYLISDTFAKYNKNEGTKKAVKNYANQYNPKKNDIGKIRQAFLRSPLFFVAEDKDKIIGIVRGTKDRVVNLFVNGEHHRRGTGKKLMDTFEQEAKKYHSREIKIRASLFATPFYESIGYRKTTGIRNFKGLKAQPMRKYLAKISN